MASESLKISHLVDFSPDSDDPGYDYKVASSLLAKALIAMAAKVDDLSAKLNVLGAKLNADGGVTDTNYAIDYDVDFESTVSGTEYTGE